MVSNVYFWLQDSKTIKLLYPAQQSKGESVQALTVWISNAVDANIPAKKEKEFKSAQLIC